MYSLIPKVNSLRKIVNLYFKASIMEQYISEFIGRLCFLMESRNESSDSLCSIAGMSKESLDSILEGSRIPSICDVYQLAEALHISPSSLFLLNNNILDKLDISVEDFQWSMENNPSLRGVVIGYLAELKLRLAFKGDVRVTRLFKYDDHDRKKKSDLVVEYKGKQISLEVKSLQTNTVKDASGNDNLIKCGKFQCDASDCREITLPDGQKVKTTLLKYGDFDILAVNLFAYFGKWEYAFALNRDLPHSTSKKYTESQQKQLIASLIPITYPVRPPFVSDPIILLEKIWKEK